MSSLRALLAAAMLWYCLALQPLAAQDSAAAWTYDGGTPPVLEPLALPHWDQAMTWATRAAGWESATEVGDGEPNGDQQAPAAPVWPHWYNSRPKRNTWVTGAGGDLRMFRFEGVGLHPTHRDRGPLIGFSWWLLDGPNRTDLPPRLYEFLVGYRSRGWWNDAWGYDLYANIGAFGDFEASARKGVRFPGHAVGYWRWSERWTLAAGLEYLDRDDISLLPVGGVIFTPDEDWRVQLVFPQPLIQWRYSPEHALFLTGDLGGGSWSVERTDLAADVATYREINVAVGRATWCGSYWSTWELAYVTGRELSFRSGVGDYALEPTLAIRFTTRY